MGKMYDLRVQVDEAMLHNLDRLAESMDRSPEALFYYALERILEDAASEAAFVQEGIDAIEAGDFIPHEIMVGKMEAMIAAHRSRCKV